MFRMSQKLLITILFLLFNLNFLWSGNWELLNSIRTGPLNLHLKNPLGIFFDKNTKRLYVVDTGNNRLISYSSTGKPLKEFNAGGTLKNPVDMVKDNNGNLWIIEKTTNSIVFINLKERKIKRKKLFFNNKEIFLDKITIWKNFKIINDRYSGNVFMFVKLDRLKKLKLKNIKGVFDIKIKNNKLWLLETLSNRIFCYDLSTEKIIKQIILKKVFSEPISFDLDANNNIYVLDRYLKKVFIFDSNGNLMNKQLKEGNRDGELYYPWYILVNQNKIFILDEGNGVVYIFKF